MIKCLFFDLDGVLLDTEKLYSYFWIAAAHNTGVEMSYEVSLMLRSCDASLAQKIISTNLGEKADYLEIRRERKRLMSDYLKNNPIEIKSGAFKLLEELSLKHKNIKKAIVTSSHACDKEKILKEKKLFQFFSDVIYAEDVKRGKPYPDIYEYAYSKMNLRPEECVAIEDSPNGVNSAWLAGIHVIMVPDLSQPDEKLREKCVIAETLAQIPDVLKREKWINEEFYKTEDNEFGKT